MIIELLIISFLVEAAIYIFAGKKIIDYIKKRLKKS